MGKGIPKSSYVRNHPILQWRIVNQTGCASFFILRISLIFPCPAESLTHHWCGHPLSHSAEVFQTNENSSFSLREKVAFRLDERTLPNIQLALFFPIPQRSQAPLSSSLLFQNGCHSLSWPSATVRPPQWSILGCQQRFIQTPKSLPKDQQNKKVNQLFVFAPKFSSWCLLTWRPCSEILLPVENTTQ